MRTQREITEDGKTRFSHRVKRSLVVLSFFPMILFLMPVPGSCADEWSAGGSLHSTSVRRWMKASSANRLATSADWFLSMTEKSNKPLLKELKAMSKEDYQEAFKYYATRLERCVSEKVEKKTVRPEDRITDYAEKCYKNLHGPDGNSGE